MFEFLNPQPKRSSSVRDFARQIFEHKDFEAGLKKINYCHASLQEDDDPKGLMLLGYSGTGKTTLLQAYKRFIDEHHGVDLSSNKNHIPVLYLRLKASTTTKQFLRQIAEELHGHPSEKASEPQLECLVRELLVQRRTEIVFLDEFHHLLKSGTERQITQVANTIKILLDDTHIPFVLAGSPHSNLILERNPELQRRFENSYTMRVLAANDKQAVIYCCHILQLCENYIKVPTPKLNDRKMALRFIIASNGMLSYIFDIIKGALESAGDGNPVEMKHLSDGYHKSRNQAITSLFDPFTASFEDVRKVAGGAK